MQEECVRVLRWVCVRECARDPAKHLFFVVGGEVPNSWQRVVGILYLGKSDLETRPPPAGTPTDVET